MSSTVSLTRKLLSTLALTSCLVAASPAPTWAQPTPGLTIFSGVERENILSYHLDYGGRSRGWDRYRFKIPAKKLPSGASRFVVSFPKYYEGTFDRDSVEVRIDGESIPVRDLSWDLESCEEVDDKYCQNQVEIDLEEPIEGEQKVELVFHNVRNPRYGGTYYFNCYIQVPNDVRLLSYVGTWILSID